MTNFICHACGDNRPEDKISVLSRDRSKDLNLPEGTVTENIRYCNDNGSCLLRARKITIIPKRKTYAFDPNRLQDIIAYCSEPMRDNDFYKRAREDLKQLAVDALKAEILLAEAVKFHLGQISEGDFKRAVAVFVTQLEQKESS